MDITFLGIAVVALAGLVGLVVFGVRSTRVRNVEKDMPYDPSWSTADTSLWSDTSVSHDAGHIDSGGHSH